ncbi:MULTISPECIES: phosphotransferase family protein [Priestia]|nr:MULTISPECIES: phosphotransferase family protein [Priestia]RCX25458.1 aminoglycoside phosphotransferase (APT) family kinase protein [Bacillus sp. AG236]MBX9994409.1 phosphotransferase family protein [Priestia aryabhattai]MCM3152106.1 phosphotransferase family protein [Priestia megaterium]MCP1451727.1 aminoglycoside phosphotransferase (APT) family kinase protein [Priestia megaterium]MCU7738988.1 phosphotransferase family protein [Priestia megaterium]
MSQIIPVRKGEELNTEKLHQFLRVSIPDLPKEPLLIKQFGSGASNLTYALSVGEWEAVLRRPPFGPVAPKAHDMQREYKILSVLSKSFPLAPRPYVFCEDETVVGKSFFLMERKHGVLIDTAFPEEVKGTSALCRCISEQMVDVLAQLHDVPYKGTLLEKISKPEGFLERQVHGWIHRYEKSKTSDIPEVEALKKWLTTHIPTTQHSTIIHYDYKLNNTLFSPDGNKIVGLFDWEMTTVGDPLADLGVALSYWMEDSDPELLKRGLGNPPVTVQKSFYSRRDFVEAYAKKSGRDVSHIDFYLKFAYFKLAVICQQIYYRYKKGQTNDKRFSQFGDYVKTLIIHALHTERGHI